MSGLQNGKGQSANLACDAALVDQRASVPIRCGRRQSETKQFLGSSTRIRRSYRAPLNCASLSREILSADAAMMACALVVAQPAAALRPCGRENLAGHLRFSGNCARVVHHHALQGKARSRGAVAKFARDSSEPSSGSVVKYVKSSIDTPEDIFALAGIGFAAVAALWASVNLIEVIDKLPVLPLLLELIGITVAWLFIYNNLLFKPDREEFVNNIKNSVSRIFGQ